MTQVSGHLDHSEKVAEQHYRLKTRSSAQETGRIVNSLLSKPAAEATSEHSSSETYEDDGVWGRTDFKPRKKPTKTTTFESRLDFRLQPKQVRRRKLDDEAQQQACLQFNVIYEPPVEGENPKERHNRRSRNYKRLYRQKKKVATDKKECKSPNPDIEDSELEDI